MAKKLGHVPDSQTTHQVEPVNFDCSHADFQIVRHLAVRQALSDEAENFFLAGRETGSRLACAGGPSLPFLLLSRA